MTGPSSPSPSPDETPAEAAAAWLLRVHAPDVTPEEMARFEAWIERDDNRRTFAAASQVWSDFDAHACEPEVVALRRDALNYAYAAARSRPRWRTATMAAQAAAAAVLVVGAGFGWTVFKPAQVYSTAMGERRAITLQDGSKVTLDEASRLSVKLRAHSRDLQLLAGQARFDVAHDTSRPFTVIAAERAVVATGTAFNVELSGPRVWVTLLQGRVLVRALPQAGALPTLALKPGEMLTASGAQAQVSEVDARDAVAWQEGKLVFDNVRLDDAVERVNRYGEQKIVISDPAIARISMSGVFNTGATMAFVEAITAYLPVRAEERPGGIIELLPQEAAAAASRPSPGHKAGA